jgi:hypothetical protein
MSHLGWKWFEKAFGFEEKYDEIHKRIQVIEEEGSKQGAVAESVFTGEAESIIYPFKQKSLILKTPVKDYPIGSFSTPTVEELRSRLTSLMSLLEQETSTGQCNAKSPKVETAQPEENNKPKRKHRSSFALPSSSIPCLINVHNIEISSVFEMHSQYPNAIFQAASQFNCLEFPNPRTVPEHGITAYFTDHTQGPACALACAAGTLYRNYFAPVAGCSSGRPSFVFFSAFLVFGNSPLVFPFFFLLLFDVFVLIR